jgi:hypothetical protein
MDYINTSGVLGTVIIYISNNVTGSVSLTLALGLLMFLFLALAFRVPLEIAVSFCYLALLGVLMYTSEFKAALVLTVFFLAAMIVRRLFR